MKKGILMSLAAAFVCGAAVAKDRIVVVPAHPDDLIPCFGTCLLSNEIFEWHVIELTHGERGLGPKGFEDGSARRIRMAEEESVCKALGATLHWLDEVDGNAYACRETCAKFAEILKELQPRAIITHWPLDQHLDHVMAFTATMKAIQLAKIEPEIYYHEQDHQSKGFQPAYWVDISSVEAEKERIIALYECQNGTHIAANKRLNGDFRGRNMRKPVRFAEAYATYPGAAQGARCIFAELPKKAGK